MGGADLLTKLRALPARYGSDGCHHANGRAILGGCYKHDCWQPSMWTGRRVEQVRGGLRHLAYRCWIPSGRNAVRDASSYGLKHRAEESARTVGSPCYVSNLCMIAACVLCGVRVHDCDSINSFAGAHRQAMLVRSMVPPMGQPAILLRGVPSGAIGASHRRDSAQGSHALVCERCLRRNRICSAQN